MWFQLHLWQAESTQSYGIPTPHTNAHPKTTYNSTHLYANTTQNYDLLQEDRKDQSSINILHPCTTWRRLPGGAEVRKGSLKAARFSHCMIQGSQMLLLSQSKTKRNMKSTRRILRSSSLVSAFICVRLAWGLTDVS